MDSQQGTSETHVVLAGGPVARMTEDAPYGLIDDGAVAIRNGQIAWVGNCGALPATHAGAVRVDLGGRLVTPALIDCHTHLVYGGNRAAEFEMRLQGTSYEEIAAAGGGILSTVRSTREASQADLKRAALGRVRRLIGEGVGTIEIKSGYGLDVETEARMLRVARDIAAEGQVRIVNTFLGAHAIPPEFQGRADDYIDFVCEQSLPAAHRDGLVDAVDAFCEGIAFTPEQVSRVFGCARQLGLPVRLHAEQLSNLGGAAMAARHGALSADHLEYLDGEGVAAMAESGMVAVLLPGAFYMLGETRRPPVKQLRAAGVPMAVSTDCNPGSSPLGSLLLAMNMACVLFGLTPEEALAGATRNAGKALGLSRQLGTIEAGKVADLAVWNAARPAELCHEIGTNPIHNRIFRGEAEWNLL